MNVEDYISADDYERCLAVINSKTGIFSELVESIGLSKESDFIGTNLRGLDLRQSDLRGFNFTNADLRDCLKDSSTIVDTTTLFNGAQIDWITKEQIPIVEAMRAVEMTKSSTDRKRKLQNLFDNYSSPDHLKRFIALSIQNARDVDKIIDFSEFYNVENRHDLNFVMGHMSSVFSRYLYLRRNPKNKIGGDLRVGEISSKLKKSTHRWIIEIAERIDTMGGTPRDRIEKALRPFHEDLFP